MLTENIRSRDQLVQAIRDGYRPEYLLFWGHKPLPNGKIGTPCFSQWWPARFCVEGVNYPTAEHFMMAEKARLFGDETIRARILTTRDPKTAKELGRQVKNFDEARWNKECFQIVVTGNLAKFKQHRDLGEFLLSTGEKVLVEASPYDRIWGIGLEAEDPRAQKPQQWRGTNLLGFALMEVRQHLGKEGF